MMKRGLIAAAAVLALWMQASAETRSCVRAIDFEGVETFRRSTLTHLMRTREATLFSHPPFSPDDFSRDLDNLAAFYLSQGFLNVQVLSYPPVYAPDSASVRLRIAITEGPRWTISDVRVEGARVLPVDTLTASLKLRKGQYYRPAWLTVDERAILDQYAARGYLDAHLSPDLSADSRSHTVSLLYRITEGAPASVSRITIRGVARTKPSTVLRELEFHAGDRFDLHRWGRSQSNLYNTGLFEWVWIQPAEADVGRAEKEVLVLAGEKPRWELSAGAGYGRFDQARIVGGVRRSNILGRGIRCNLEGKISRKVRRSELLVSEPWFLGRRIAANAAAVYRWRDEAEFLAETVEGGLLLTKALRQRVELEGGYRLRRTTLLRVGSSLVVRDRRNRTSVLGTAVSWKMRDDLFNTTRGFFLRIEAEYAGTFLGGTNQFLRGNVFWRHFIPLPTGVVLASSFRLGALTPLHTGGIIPINERYFLGGDRSVRGYPRHSLGPTDSRGNANGGRKLVELGQEFRFPLGRRLRGVLFCDQGILFNSHPHRDDWAAGAGGGLRIITPFGVLRAEVARSLTERWGIGTEYYLSVGQSF